MYKAKIDRLQEKQTNPHSVRFLIEKNKKGYNDLNSS